MIGEVLNPQFLQRGMAYTGEFMLDTGQGVIAYVSVNVAIHASTLLGTATKIALAKSSLSDISATLRHVSFINSYEPHGTVCIKW